MKYKSEDYKISAVKYYLYNEVIMEDVCDIFDCTSSSLSRWVQKYEETNNIQNTKRESTSYKITNEQVQYALKLLKKMSKYL